IPTVTVRHRKRDLVNVLQGVIYPGFKGLIVSAVWVDSDHERNRERIVEPEPAANKNIGVAVSIDRITKDRSSGSACSRVKRRIQRPGILSAGSGIAKQPRSQEQQAHDACSELT